MYNMPFFNYPYYRNYYPRAYSPKQNMNFRNPYYENIKQSGSNYSSFNEEQIEKTFNDKKDSTTNNSSSTINDNSRFNVSNHDDKPFINLLGIDLYSDDILILCILLSLYLEGVKDEMLFISLILLLLT